MRIFFIKKCAYFFKNFAFIVKMLAGGLEWTA